MEGSIIIADGVNGSPNTKVFNTAVLSLNNLLLFTGSAILCREALCGMSNFNCGDISMDIGYISLVNTASIGSSTINEYRTTTSIDQRTIRNLTFTSTNITFNAPMRTWNVDLISATQVRTKITTYIDQVLQLVIPLAYGVAQLVTPPDPENNNYVIWQDNATANILIKITDSTGLTKTATLVNFSTI